MSSHILRVPLLPGPSPVGPLELEKCYRGDAEQVKSGSLCSHDFHSHSQAHPKARAKQTWEPNFDSFDLWEIERKQ